MPPMLSIMLNTNNSIDVWGNTGAEVNSLSSPKWLQGVRQYAEPTGAMGKGKRTKEKYKAILFI